MSRSRSRKRSSRNSSTPQLGKPQGVLNPRVQQVGPEHFGIVCFARVRGVDLRRSSFASRERLTSPRGEP